jgi:hypothetical protein
VYLELYLSGVWGLSLHNHGTALGVSEEIAALGLKGNKKKRAKRLDEDFNVSCHQDGITQGKLRVVSSTAGSEAHVAK